MSFLTKVSDFLTGGIGGEIVDAVKSYFPPSMSEQEKAQLAHQIQQAADAKALQAQQLANQAQAEFNTRIKQLEGTASDLKAIPVFGHIVLFLRGTQRPLWGYATLYMDVMVFSGKWQNLSNQQESALWVINLLVLGFLFGERAIKNASPVIERLIKAKVGR